MIHFYNIINKGEMSMEYLNERAAYLRGLCDGLDISEETKEGKIILELIDVVADLSDALVELKENQDEIEEYVESIDEDLSDLEVDFYDIGEDEEFYDDDDYLEMTCPSCGTEVEVSGEDLEDEGLTIHCPECDEVLIESVEESEDEM